MANDINLDQVLHTFIVEARELLEDMEAALLRVADEADPRESIHAIFRAAHTIKGSSGLFGLDAVVTFTHVVESVLDRVRDGAVSLDESLVPLMLSSGDYIGRLVDAVERGEPQADPKTEPEGAALLERLQKYLVEQDAPVAATASTGATTATAGGAAHWHLSLRFGPDVLRNGMDPLSFIRYLATLGTIEHIVTLPDAVPGLDALDPEGCCLGFEIGFLTTVDKAAIENVFEFVIDDCALRIVPPGSQVEQYIELIRSQPEGPSRLGEILVRCGSVTARELETALRSQADSTPAQKIGAILAEQGKVAPQVVEAALARQKQVKETRAPESQSVRVDADKLDRLINLVGELIIAAAGANLVAKRTRNLELIERNSTLSDLVEEVRDSALQLRMVKIGGTFARFKRVVHDVARELGKDIELAVSGEDTELDKTVVEKIGDPLMHLVRNAMDHGIDAPELRAARGKPATGTVSLNAFHDSGSIVIQVGDDGGGLDREKILAKGIERGLVEPGRAMSDAEVYALIFEPGFSTAEQITNLSGRGVGMDVVKRNIAALRGNVAIASEPGRGTTVTVRLPLTLAIINGFQVAVGKSVFVVPMDMVDECVEFSAEAGHDYTDLRGQVLPFVRLRELFDVPGTASTRQNIVVVKHAGQKFGLVVDGLLGEAQTVIKPLSRMFAQVRGISGSSILGSGDVALILDVPLLLQEAQEARSVAARHAESLAAGQ
ncbi:chemotaxis protein CheA [Scleromatobacter humisilvae]|uniref:Chemotaxis protein CheA n=1 Tax=Scleromatobacter humisilvae TaxID=2897159 RepID=A0A9X1YPW6_9BURK|nr:chemotaxis protein CheA [Scleromatobacter humisilvae]MCK9689170.1 chemotaxis protein CheA [Scleromatobacter humisilvae]